MTLVGTLLCVPHPFASDGELVRKIGIRIKHIFIRVLVMGDMEFYLTRTERNMMAEAGVKRCFARRFWKAIQTGQAVLYRPGHTP